MKIRNETFEASGRRKGVEEWFSLRFTLNLKSLEWSRLYFLSKKNKKKGD